MTQNTSIEWCDHTASPWHGCTKVAAGCDHCYAERMAKRNPDVLGVWGPDGVRVRSKSFEKNVRRWNAEAAAAGKTVSVFPSICDPFEDRPELVPWREEMFELIDQCPYVTFLLLTKRPENIAKMWSPNVTAPTFPLANYWLKRRPNVWLGTSIATQEDADRNVPHLLQCRGLSLVLFLSAEPLLGEVEISGWLWGRQTPCEGCPRDSDCECNWSTAKQNGEPTVDWVIVGGESGPNARPMHPAWARLLRDQCQAAGVPFLFKQNGEWAPVIESKGMLASSGEVSGLHHVFRDASGAVLMSRMGKKRSGRLLDGVEHNEFPQV